MYYLNYRRAEGRWEASEALTSRGLLGAAQLETWVPSIVLQFWGVHMQSCSVPAEAIHTIRQKLQVILAVAEGDSAFMIEQNVREIDGLLPKPGVWFSKN